MFVQKVTVIVEIDGVAFGETIEKNLVLERVGYPQLSDLVDPVEANRASHGVRTQRLERQRRVRNLAQMLEHVRVLFFHIAEFGHVQLGLLRVVEIDERVDEVVQAHAFVVLDHAQTQQVHLEHELVDHVRQIVRFAQCQIVRVA